jgi:indole-3-glycerol phosphate synthase
MNAGFLKQMALSAAFRVAQAKARVSEEELRGQAHAAPAPPPLTLHSGGFDLIAEVKFRSPAAGPLVGPDGQRDLDEVTARARGYAEAGAAAVSVLTEPTRFDGSLEHLRAAATALREVGVPAMRKDFLVDRYQVLEARVAGAGGVLVIVRMLDDAVIESLLDCARDLDLFVLLEAFDETDIERAHGLIKARRATGSRAGRGETLLMGVNCRDLDTLKVVPGRLESLAHRLPASVPRVAESGVASAADAARVSAAGYDLALVGTALMTGESPAVLARGLIEGGRSVRIRAGAR